MDVDKFKRRNALLPKTESFAICDILGGYWCNILEMMMVIRYGQVDHGLHLVRWGVKLDQYDNPKLVTVGSWRDQASRSTFPTSASMAFKPPTTD
ncbi:hypothetical protein Cantr_03223 [Candida viswanathii]|uniref:Uncharacterized protein n=1 Tax=Candida viswanathii TaxID=5486 RepID=A0A367YP12_9ASCO|nr:hypothetical protein Cantr_03223 [Candida viswanathii]